MYTIFIDSCPNANRSRVIRADIERLLICFSSSNLFVFERATRPRFVSSVFVTFFSNLWKIIVIENLFFNNICLIFARRDNFATNYIFQKIYLITVCTVSIELNAKKTGKKHERNGTQHKLLQAVLGLHRSKLFYRDTVSRTFL